MSTKSGAIHVSLHGDPKKKRLWSYIEYFRMFRLVVLLSDVYNDPRKNEVYAIDPISGERIAVKITPQIIESEFTAMMAREGLDRDKHKAAEEYAPPIILSRGRSRTLEWTVREGFEYAAKRLGLRYIENVPKEKAAKFTKRMTENFLHQYNTWFKMAVGIIARDR